MVRHLKKVNSSIYLLAFTFIFFVGFGGIALAQGGTCVGYADGTPDCARCGGSYTGTGPVCEVPLESCSGAYYCAADCDCGNTALYPAGSICKVVGTNTTLNLPITACVLPLKMACNNGSAISFSCTGGTYCSVDDFATFQFNIANSVTGGYGQKTIRWTVENSNYSNSQSITHKFASGGTKTVTVYAKDESNQEVQCNKNVIITEKLAFTSTPSCSLVTQPYFTQDSLFLPEAFISWKTTVKGGDLKYDYDWNGVSGRESVNSQCDKLGLSSQSSLCTIYYTEDGDKTMTVSVTSAGQTISADCPVAKVGTPEIEVSTLKAKTSITGSCPQGEGAGPDGLPCRYYVGDFITWFITATGGTGNFKYVWTGDTGTAGPIDRSALSPTTYSTPGNKTVNVTVSSGSKITNPPITKTINVEERTLVVTCAGSPTEGNVGDEITWVAYPEGGRGEASYIYSWQGYDDDPSKNIMNFSSKEAKVRYYSVGPKSATVTVTSGTVSVPATCNVDISMRPVTLQCSSIPIGTGYIGDAVNFGVRASNGTGKFSYLWELKDGGQIEGVATDPTLKARFMSEGVYHANVVVKALKPDGTPVTGTGEYRCDPDIAINIKPRPPVCGNGDKEEGETTENCCIDVACPVGQKCIPKADGTFGCQLPKPPGDKPPPEQIDREYPNPLGDVKDVGTLVAKIADLLVGLLAPLIVLFIIIAGVMFVTARGNPEKLNQAKKTITFTLIGAAVMLGAWAFAELIKSFFG
jgi:hypothetical protein